MQSNIESLYKTIATGCLMQRPEQWESCVFIYKEIERFSSYNLYYILPGGQEKYYEADDSAADAMELLRTEMAKLNNGQAWYTAVFKMTPDGKFKFDFDYDHLPAFDIMPQPDKWQDEFKKYPRPELQAQIQDWLDGSIGYDRADELVKRLADLQRTA